MYNVNRGVGNMKKTSKIGHRLLPTTTYMSIFFFQAKYKTFYYMLYYIKILIIIIHY
jgi:hypothetical protein